MQEKNLFNHNGNNLNLVSADYLRGTHVLGKDNRESWYGGTELLETPHYIGAFNHFN